MSSPLLSIAGIEKSYRGQKVLDVDALDVAEGDRIQIVGRNGSGKSTLLRIFGGIAVPTRGTVVRHERMRRSRVGFVPQDGGLYQELTLRQNIRLVVTSIAGSDVRSDSLPILDAFGLMRFLDQPVQVLSDGMRRLAAILSVLVADPEVLLVDEPMTGIDPVHEEQLEHLLIDVARSAVATIITTHTPRPGLASWRVVQIANGRL